MKTNFGEFLKTKRQEKNLTQKELANLVFVTESAVCKWERNVAHPDITLLPKLCSILGVTEHELITASIDDETREEKKQAKKWRTLSIAWDMFFGIGYLIALITCFICNLAINKTLSWFWIVLSALMLAFTFTHLPKLIKMHKLILLPTSMYVALCLLLGVCAIYSKGSWFFVASFSVLFGLLTIFTPIYIAKYDVFNKIKKYNDFVSIGIDFILLNILLIIINLNTLNAGWWYFKIALPIVLSVYIIINILLSVRFIRTNRFIKTGIVLFLINTFLYLPPMILNFENQEIQNEINQVNILKADLSVWKVDGTLGNNVHLIIALVLLLLSTVFFCIGVIKLRKNVNND